MAEGIKSDYEEQFTCSVCLDILKGPVTIPCGHSYCMSCINKFWVDLDHNGVHSCPQCRETFSPKPALKRNTVLAEVMEKLKITSGQTGAVRIDCDSCIGTKNTADKFCQQCLASFCELHLQPHYESPAFMKHKLVQASVQVQKNICPHHGKLLDVYCNDDQQCICYLCMMENHKEHRTSSVESEMIRNQDALERTKIQCQQMIDQREEGLQELNKAVTSFECFAQAAEGDSERIFAELISSMKRKCSEVKELIRAQEKRKLNQAEGKRIQLSHDLTELRTKMTDIQQLLATKDPIDFMREYHSTRAMPTFNDLPSLTCQHHESSENISLCELKERVEEICQQEVGRISREVQNLHVVQPTEPKTREEFLDYFCDLHVDLNTINNFIFLSEDKKVMSSNKEALPYPYHPERFDGYCNVLCKESLSGRCYWEVAFSGNDWSMAVAYKGIKRKGQIEDCRFGFNAQSWRFCKSSKGFYARHDQTTTHTRPPNSSTIGVYLNHDAGTLSFYSVSDTMTLLYTFHTKFTEPVYAGFGVSDKSVIRILQINKGQE